MRIELIEKDIEAEFASCQDWFDKYDLLIRMGRESPGLDDTHRVDANAIPGCQSNVWLKASVTDGRLSLQADSDALITKGILSLLIRVYNDQYPQDVLDARLEFLDTIGLTTNLSPSRSDGLSSIIRRIREIAAKSLAEGS